jgi:hypothetical protein
MYEGTKTGFSTISLERLQCAMRDFTAPQKEEEEEPNALALHRLQIFGMKSLIRCSITLLSLILIFDKHNLRVGGHSTKSYSQYFMV